VALVAAVGLAAWLWPRPEAPSAVLARSAVQDASGRPVTLAGRFGRVSLLHFWATWCRPCRAEVPALLRLAAARHADRDFALVMVAVADDPQAVAAFLGDARGALARMLYDDWTVARALGTEGVPESYLVVDGRVVASFVGATDWDAASVRQRLTAAVSRASGL